MIRPCTKSLNVAIKYNNILAENQQVIQVLIYKSDFIKLSTIEIHGSDEVRKFRSRLRGNFTKHIMDTIYVNFDSHERDSIVKTLKAEQSSRVNKQLWQELPDGVREDRTEHMRRIQRTVDQAAIRRGEPWNKGLTKHDDDRLLKTL